ncbi:MAG TPA: SCO family protein [Novosphingobium sp.]|nr:SCO family protein [Novosphingobium sp.]
MTKPNLRAALRLATLGLATLTLAACLPSGKDAEPPAITGASIEGSTIGGPFTLYDKDGKPRTWDSFKGKYRIVYFGYTFCPDACPMDVSVMIQGFTKFAKDHPDLAAQVQPIFITVDPARDTPARVGEFTAAFSPSLLGLTGSPAEVEVAVKAFKVASARGADTPGGYLMDHSRMAYLMGRNGEPIAALPVDLNPDAVASDLAKLVK